MLVDVQFYIIRCLLLYEILQISNFLILFFKIQVHMWSADANQYVADEDDVTYSCRVSG